jgi:hypothetical protein
MPIEYVVYQSQSARLEAWRTHYIGKGCNPSKAYEAAGRKRFGVTWPVAVQETDRG